MQAAQDRQKSYADRKRKPMEFEVGDRVMLKVSPWKGVVRFGKRGKLNPRYVGPFKVLAKVGKVAYRLELPQELSRVHHTFHVSNLKKCYADEPLVMPLEGIHVDDKLQFVEEPVEIMEREIKRLKRSRIPLVKVRWNSRRGPEFTWEREDSFKQKYPQLFTNRASSSTTRAILEVNTARLKKVSTVAEVRLACREQDAQLESDGRDVYVRTLCRTSPVFKRLDVWELVDRPLCKNVINMKWLWKNKHYEENIIIRNKACLVAKGYSQVEVYQMEVKTAFLNGPLNEEVYVDPHHPDKVYRLKKACYQARPTEKHLREVKQNFRYLKNTINMELRYPKDIDFELTAFSDSDHAGCLDSRKSTSGGIQILGDDKLVEKGIVELFFVGTEYQLADLFTKALSEDRFKYLVRRLGMRCLTPEELEVLENKSA
ncbi:hypothetical protein Tco_0650866 [Tanacetum coccineum]